MSFSFSQALFFIFASGSGLVKESARFLQTVERKTPKKREAEPGRPREDKNDTGTRARPGGEAERRVLQRQFHRARRSDLVRGLRVRRSRGRVELWDPGHPIPLPRPGTLVVSRRKTQKRQAARLSLTLISGRAAGRRHFGAYGHTAKPWPQRQPPQVGAAEPIQSALFSCSCSQPPQNRQGA